MGARRGAVELLTGHPCFCNIGRLEETIRSLTTESDFSHNLDIRNSAKRRPGSKLFKNSGVEFLDPLP